MAYTANNWRVGNPITQELMNHIEQGIQTNSTAVEDMYRKNEIDSKVTTLNNTIGEVRRNAESALSTAQTADGKTVAGQNAWDAITTATTDHDPSYSSLNSRFAALETMIDTAQDTADTAMLEISNAWDPNVEKDSLYKRFTRIEFKNTQQDSHLTSIDDIFTQLAIQDPALGTADASLADRLNRMQREIGTVTTEVKNARGTNNTALVQHFDAIDTEISNARGGLNSLDARLDAIDDSLTSGSMVNRLSAVETRAEGLNTNYNTLSGTVNNIKSEIEGARPNGSTLDDRFDAIESRLDDIDGTSSNTLDSRVSTLESDVGTIKTDLNTATTGLKARVTTVEGKVSTIESDLNTATTGLKAKVGTLETQMSTANAAINNAATKNQVSDLTDRVDALEKADTIVVHSATFDAQGRPNSIISPLTTADYLIKGDDNKYYYWRYINSQWQLISGAGGGSSNACYDFANEAAYTAATKEQNADYYVKKDDGYHHYRYVMISGVLTEIEIGSTIDINNIKRYNMIKTTVTNENKDTINYLDLYEFGYGADTTLNPDDLPPVQQRVAHIVLPEGGGGGGAVTSAVLARIPPTSITTIKNNDPIYLRFFFSCVDATSGSHDGEYQLKDKNGIVLESGPINSGAANADISAWPKDREVSGMAELQDREDGIIYDDGYGSIDVSKYCILGSNKFFVTVTVADTQESPTRNWTVITQELRLESIAPETLMVEAGTTVDIPYVPFGAMQKYLNITIDGTSQPSIPLGSNITGADQIYTVPAQTHGAHRIEMQLSTTINGRTVYSEPLKRDYIWYDSSITPAVIIASPYRNNASSPLEVTQYSEVEIPYTVYKAGTNTVQVEYYYDYNLSGENTPFNTVTLTNTNSGTLRYNINDAGSHRLTVKVDNVTMTVHVQATSLLIDISPVVGSIIDFNPSTLSNNSANREPSWIVGGETYKLSVSDNFNWSDNASGGGYHDDGDNGRCFVIKAGTYATLNYKMFKQRNVTGESGTTTTSAVFDNGTEMKLIFKVSAVRNASAIWFTNTGKSTAADDKVVGIQLSAHEGWLKTDKATDTETSASIPEGYELWEAGKAYEVGDVVVYIKDGNAVIYQCITANSDTSWPKKKWQSLGQLETEISATNSYLYFPYSEDDKIELDININQHGNNEDFIMSYEDGVPSKAYPYNYATGGDILYHVRNNESEITIGSPDCDVYIYRLRIYDKSLKTDDILKNFIADGATIDERINRYNRNAVYYDPTLNENKGGFIPYKQGNASLDPYHLAERMKDVKILMLDTPRFTTGKKDFVKNSSLRCIQAIGGEVYPARLNEDNWYFFNGYHAGQGTTSDNYGQSARNVDFLFECDGTHAPTKSGNLQAGEWLDYVSGVAIGNEASVYDEGRTNTWTVREGVTPDTCLDWKGDHCKIALTSTSIPNNYFNLKTNVASSENVNNALFQKRYTDYLPYTSPAKKRDSRIKNGMEFVPAVLFVRENDPDLSTHKEFNDTNWHFYALGNIGDSKKTDYTRAYDPNDMNEFTIEISDNNTSNSQFQSGVYLTDPNDPSTRTVETAKTNVDPMSYTYPITEHEWNALDSNNEYVNYRHKMLVTEAFDGDHSFEFRYACRGDYRDGDLINDTSTPTGEVDGNGDPITEDTLQFDINRNVWFAFYSWVVTSTKEQFRAEASQWFVPSAVEFFYAFTHFYTMMDNRAKNTFWHFAKTGEYRRVSRPVPELFHVYETAEGTVTTDVNGVCTGTFVPATGTFNPNGEYYTQYAFDLWVYDTDTACGIDNNGELSFPYGKEDKDYRVSGQPGSGWAFNGSGSIFWRRLSDPSNDGGFEDEIAALMRQEDDNCFSTAQHLIDQFDKFQECYPEEIWRLDIQRKYIRTFTGKSYDNSITTNKQNIRFLRAMMQGRKKYQRRQWVRNQAIYFGSKYGLNNVHTSDHTIEFNIYGPSVAPNGVPIDYTNLIVVPYQDMYIDVAVGNSTTNLDVTKLQRAKAGERVRVDCSGGSLAQETRVYIFGGEHIMALENLAPMYPYSGSFGQGKHLKALDLGSENPNYDNPRFTSISINANMPLLETFSVKNCNRLAQDINLSESNNLRVIEAEGSLITGVSLPPYTNITTLHLPHTVSSVVLQSARELVDFYIKNKATGLEDYSNLVTLNINDSDYSSIDWIDIASQTLNNKIEWLYLQNLINASIDNLNELEPFVLKKRALEVDIGDDGELIKHIILSGDLTVTGEWGEQEYQDYNNTWQQPPLNIIVDPSKKITQHKVTFKYDDNTNGGAEICHYYVSGNNTSLTDPYPDLTGEITKAPDQQYSYSFGTRTTVGNYVELSGWQEPGSNIPANQDTQLSPITRDIILETRFTRTDRTYKVRWYLHENDRVPIIESSSYIPYGGGYDLEVPTVQDILAKGGSVLSITPGANIVSYEIFDGWDKIPANINPGPQDEAYNIYARWRTGSVNLSLLDANTVLTPEILLVLSRNSSPDIRRNQLDTYDPLEITMGYDGIEAGTQLLARRFDSITGYSPVGTGIYPFADSTAPFTLAIDYRFNTNELEALTNKKQSILVGCEATVGGSIQSLRLFYDHDNKVPRIGFGDTTTVNGLTNQTVQIGNTDTVHYRNVVVLRHPANSPTLYVYCYNNADGLVQTMDMSGIVQSINWAGGNTLNTNAELIFGSYTRNNTSGSYYDKGRGTIYWAKYWDKDLGAGECQRLASWPHEQMTFGIEDYNGMSDRVVSTAVSQPNITLTALTASASTPLSLINTSGNPQAGDKVAWSTSKLHDYANNRIFNGFPTYVQSIMADSNVKHMQAEYNYDDRLMISVYKVSGDALTSSDKIFFPSYKELGGSTATYSQEANRAYDWIDEDNMTVWQYSSTGDTRASADHNVSYQRIRFPIVPLDDVPTVYIYPANHSTPLYTQLVNASEARRGAVMIPEGEDTAYVYVTADDVLAGAPVVPNTGIFTCVSGGWVAAVPYWTRSVFDNNQTGNTYRFMYVKANGALIQNAPGWGASPGLTTCGLDISFSI